MATVTCAAVDRPIMFYGLVLGPILERILGPTGRLGFGLVVLSSQLKCGLLRRSDGHGEGHVGI